MNKKIYTIIIWIITLLVIAYVVTKKDNLFQFDINNSWNNSEIEEKDSSDSNHSYRINENLDYFSNIIIDSNVMSIKVEQGDYYGINVSYNKEKFAPKYKVSGDTLTISQNLPKNQNKKVHVKTIVYVPRGANLDEVKVKLNVGEISLKDFDANSVKVLNNVGEIQIKNINFETLKAETNVGELSIKLLDNVSDYDIKAKTDIGELNIDGKKYRHSFSQRGSNGKSISAETNIGELSIK